MPWLVARFIPLLEDEVRQREAAWKVSNLETRLKPSFNISRIQILHRIFRDILHNALTNKWLHTHIWSIQYLTKNSPQSLSIIFWCKNKVSDQIVDRVWTSYWLFSTFYFYFWILDLDFWSSILIFDQIGNVDRVWISYWLVTIIFISWDKIVDVWIMTLDSVF